MKLYKAKHGHNRKGNRSPTYRSWAAMRYRCNGVNGSDYHHYGGRGIKVCKRWDKFENFLADMGEAPAKGYTLERINTNGNYTKKNCRWATQAEQVNNCRSNIRITYKGRTQNLKQWATELGISYQAIKRRMKIGWPSATALETPIKKSKRGKLFRYEGQSFCLKEWARSKNIKFATLHKRVTYQGMSIKQALETPVKVYK